MIDFTPDPVFFRILGIPIYWYGIAYAVGLAVVYWVLIREARFRGLDETLVGTGMIVVAVAALIGGRAVPRDRPVASLRGPPDHGDPADRDPARRLVCVLRVHRPRRARRDHHRHDRRLPLRPLEAPELLDVGRRRRAGPVRDAGHRPLGELLQPGAVRPADEPAVGHRDRLPPTGSRTTRARRTRCDRRTSSRCSCTSRSPGSSARWS